MSEEVKQEGEFKMPPKKKRGRPKKLSQNTDTIKVDLTKKEEDAVQEPETTKVVLQSSEPSEEKREETKVELQEVGETHEEQESTEEKSEEPQIIEINTEEKVEEKETQPVAETQQVPENLENLVNFMSETGGTIEDYVRLNADYSNIKEDELLRLYYAKTKPHLDAEEIDFILEDQFSVDESYDNERDIKKKKLAYKEEIVKAKGFLEKLKNDYYAEIKLRPGVTQEQIKATEFFNKYNKEQEIAQQKHEKFTLNTKKFFNEDFKGFEFNLGEKRFRYGVKNSESVADSQSNLSNFVEKFFNKEGDLNNYNDYHKAIYTAENADQVANHFYEQGKADAIKDMMAKSKNVDNAPRATSTGDIYVNGMKVKAISGVDSSKLKLRINKK